MIIRERGRAVRARLGRVPSTYGTYSPYSTYRTWRPWGRPPCAAGTYPTREAGTRSPYRRRSLYPTGGWCVRVPARSLDPTEAAGRTRQLRGEQSLTLTLTPTLSLSRTLTLSAQAGAEQLLRG